MEHRLNEIIIIGHLADYVRNANEGNAEAVSNLYFADANVVTPTELWCGKGEIRQALEEEYGRPNRPPIETEVADIKYDHAGQSAIVTERFVQGDIRGWSVMQVQLIRDRFYIMGEHIVLT